MFISFLICFIPVGRAQASSISACFFAFSMAGLNPVVQFDIEQSAVAASVEAWTANGFQHSLLLRNSTADRLAALANGGVAAYRGTSLEAGADILLASREYATLEVHAEMRLDAAGQVSSMRIYSKGIGKGGAPPAVVVPPAAVPPGLLLPAPMILFAAGPPPPPPLVPLPVPAAVPLLPPAVPAAVPVPRRAAVPVPRRVAAKAKPKANPKARGRAPNRVRL